jgi:hypothetical protein
VARQESPGSLSRFFLNLFFSRYRKEGETFEEMEESDGERGVWVTLRCYNCREYVRCEKPQETPIHLSTDRTTMRVILQRLEENHGNFTEILTKKAEDLDPSRVSQISW